MAPRVTSKVFKTQDTEAIPKDQIILEKDRNQVSIGFYVNDQMDCVEKSILKIGRGDDKISPQKLGFMLVHYQYIIRVGLRTFFFVPLTPRELKLKQVFEIKFDKNLNFTESNHKFDL